MTVLVDECLPAWLAAQLRDAGFDAVHVGDLGLLGAPDEKVLAAAAVEDRVVVSADTDFGDLLRASGRTGPSVVLLRGRATMRQRLDLLVGALRTHQAELAAGAIVVVRRPQGTRVRLLPLP